MNRFCCSLIYRQLLAKAHQTSYKRAAASVILAATLFLGPVQTIQAQSYTSALGFPPFTTAQPVQNGIVDLANGNLHIEIPISNYPERGQGPLSARFVYDSRIWQAPNGVWSAASGWMFSGGVAMAQINNSQTFISCGASGYT